MEPHSQKVSRVAFAYLWSILFWMGLAFLAAGEDKVRIWERGLHTSYWTALLVDGAFLLSAALLTPPVFAIVHRYPITKPIRFHRVAGYVLGSALFIIACVSLRWILLPPWSIPAQRFEQRSLHGLVTGFYSFAEMIWNYTIVLAAAHAYEYFKRAKDQELELQQALATSELQALKSQLHSTPASVMATTTACSFPPRLPSGRESPLTKISLGARPWVPGLWYRPRVSIR